MLTKRTVFPVGLCSFVATQVYIARGKERHHLVQHIFDKGEYAVVACTINNLCIFTTQTRNHSDEGFHHRTGQFGVSGKGGVGMGGHFYFRNNFDLPAFGVIDNLFHLLLGVESPLSCLFAGKRVFSGRKRFIPFHPPGSYLG